MKANPPLARLLTTSAIRTESGVTPFAVMTKPYICPGQCTFCPLELGMPKSYLSDEPAAARARSLDFDPARQIESRLTQLELTGHETDKIELIVIGGTFGNYEEDYEREFFHKMIDAVNELADGLREQYPDALLMTFATVLPTIFLSGFFFPFDAMPEWLQFISHIIPARYALQIVRGIMP